MAGWDCHGLPVELAVEKELGFTGKPDIEAYGIAEFNAKCRESVQRHVDAFERMSERMGYWADYEHAYWTMNPDYVESVWWALKTIFDKGLLVEDYRVTPYCPRCGTGLSDHEVAQGYEDVVDPSVYVRFPLTSGPWAGRADLLVWTTTPWTLVSNTAVAVNPEVTYVVAELDGNTLVVAEPLLHKALGEGATVLASFSGRELERWTYPRPFDYVEHRTDAQLHRPGRLRHDRGRLRPRPPGAGLRRGRPRDLPGVRPAGGQSDRPDGHFTPRSRSVGGVFFKDADEQLVGDLRARGLLLRHVPYEHAYPHCWRCHTPLMYFALPSWYVRTTAIKDQLLAENEATNWFPATIKHGRYGDWLNNNIDWALSRDRYWGTPLPIWRNDVDPSVVVCVGSLTELAELSGVDARRSAPPVRRRRDVHPSRRARHVPPRSAGHRRLVRLGLDAVRAVRRAAPQRRPRRRELPGRLHLRGDRPDPRLVLHADGGRDARPRPQLVPERPVPGPHPGRGRPQDEQASRQHPRTRSR